MKHVATRRSRIAGAQRNAAGSLAWLLIAIGCVSAAHADGLPGKWLEVRSENFVVVSNASQKQAEKTAEHFEQIHELFTQAFPRIKALASEPLEVYALRDEKTMKRFLPAIWESRKRSRPAGLFRFASTSPQIVIRADTVWGENFRVLYHEYFHFLVHNGVQLRLPTWIDEGLAEFWGGTRLTPKAAEVGLANNYHLAVLREGRFLPLDVLVSVDRSSPHYRQSNKTSLFYAQSWALVHYLILGDPSGEGAEQLRSYLIRIADGVESQEALTQTFGDLSKLESELRTYVRKLLFRYAKLPAPSPLSEGQLQIRKIPPAEAAALGARFILESGRARDAEDLVAFALEGAPKLAAAHEAAGLLHIQRAEHKEATRAFEQALQQDNTGALSYYGLAVLQFHEDRTDESLAIIEQHLQKAIAAAPEFAPAFARLAEVYRRTDASPDQALTHIRRAQSIKPNILLYQLKEAQILLEGGDKEAANTVVGEVVSQVLADGNTSQTNSICWNGSLWGLAAAVLAVCDHSLELDPDNRARLDSRGVARALVGDLDGALSDLRAAVELAKDDWSAEVMAKRKGWIASLEGGVNPFLGEGSAESREDLEAEDLGWLR